MFRYGKAIGLRMVLTDISEQKEEQQRRHELEKKLATSSRLEALGRLAGGVVHNLSNTLSPIVGYPELLLSKIPKDSELFTPLQTIKNSAEQAAAIMEDLLILTRPGITQTSLLQLNTIIHEYFNSSEHERIRMFHPHITFHTKLNEDIPRIMASETPLSKSITHLIDNAAEAIQEKGIVSIETYAATITDPIQAMPPITSGTYTVLEIRDTGIGIQSNVIEKIFQPFYSVKITGRNSTGLGLTVVRTTVDNCHGHIQIISKQGEGTTFRIYFPVAITSDFIKQSAAVSIEEYRGNGTVLVIDDVQEQREIANMMLSRLGYTVQTASSGEEALELIQKQSFDILVIDMILPNGINGFETYRRIKEQLPHQKAIIISGYAGNSLIQEAMNLGAGAFLRKPLSLLSLGKAIHKELSPHIS